MERGTGEITSKTALGSNFDLVSECIEDGVASFARKVIRPQYHS